ncbi:MAG: ATP-binding domain-containing protein [Actinomycetota bacterium]|nr:ATP-binding domain-containing protein [Actinomycetota bacterium]
MAADDVLSPEPPADNPALTRNPPGTDDPVLAAERAHLDRARECLGQMRATARALNDAGGDAFASEMLGRSKAVRLKSLADDGTIQPFFGRTDRLRDDKDDAAGLEQFHIGRRHVRDEAGDPVVIDWRAPMSRPFYQATPAQPLGVALRRRFGFAGARLTSYEDEALITAGGDAEADAPLANLVVQEIERPRAGPMRDIVATIAADQDDIVRAPLETSLCIQGSPGTGKTAVGLHRAAYLLYTYPDRLHRSGVLVLGPNAAFLRYIGAVLPALGELDVTQTTVDQLTARVPVRGNDSEDVAQLKGDERWAAVLRRAVYGAITRPQESIQVRLSDRRYRIPVERLRRYVDDVRRSGVPYAIGRERLAMTVAEDARRQKEQVGGSPTDPETRRCARSAELRDWLAVIWPEIDSPQIVHSLLTDPVALAAASRGLFSPAELAQLAVQQPPSNPRSVHWSVADAVLIDEVEGLLRRTELFGHVILDEAQDLSAMQLRAVARRAQAGSVTLLGDIAQGTSPWSTTDWASSLASVGKPDAVIQVLTKGYRVPGEILHLANRLLPDLAPQLPPATSVRPGRGAVALRRVTDLVESLASIVATILSQPGSIGVIAADADVEPLAEALATEGVAAVRLSAAGPADVSIDDAGLERVTLVPASLAKGLEYDHVVLVEPAAIVAAEQRGLHRLYVAMTRAVTSLTVVHTRRLPAQLHG